jgi:metallophosphoesterase (TIGR03767 family)
MTLAAALCGGVAVSEAGSGPDGPRLDPASLLDRLEAGNPARADRLEQLLRDGRCPDRLAQLGLCRQGDHDGNPQADFIPFDADARQNRSPRQRRAGQHGHEHPDTLGASDHAVGPTFGKTTIEATIQGTGDPADGFQTLMLGDGEPRVLREELAEAQSGRAQRRRSLLYVGQTTDWQLADEESPSRVEFVDIAANPPFPNVVSAAWRPQEALGAAAIEQSVRQINRFTGAGPVRHLGDKRAAMDMVLMTGDQADNQHLNETDWVVRLLEGGPINPNSGVDPSACPQGQQPSGQTADPALYAGVQDYDDYVEGQQFYDPDQPAGPKYSDWPSYPGLMDRAQEPFQAAGLDVPSYVVLGNHDALAQGNQKAIQPFEQVGLGCLKPLVPVADLTEVANVLDPNYLAGLLNTDPDQVMFVPPDPARQYVDRAQYKQRFDTGAQDDAHGLGLVDPGENAASNGAATYYAFDAKPGVRMIGLETNCDGGVAGPSANGNVDDPQFQWLRAELEAASDRDQLIVVFGHHPIRSLDCTVPDETPPPCTIDDAHGHDINPGCDADPRDSSPLHDGEDLTALFHEFPHVIAYIAGHTHENTVADFDNPGGGPGDFWGIETASLVDWPPQNRLIQMMDNCDGTLSIFGTTLDSAAPATAPEGGSEADGMSESDLGSISRTLSFNDPQAGAGTGEGTPGDRNVELLLDDPREDPQTCKSDGGGDGSGPGSTGAEPSGDAGGSLPFTGLLLGGLVAIGLALVFGGSVFRRLTAPRGPQ